MSLCNSNVAVLTPSVTALTTTDGGRLLLLPFSLLPRALADTAAAGGGFAATMGEVEVAVIAAGTAVAAGVIRAVRVRLGEAPIKVCWMHVRIHHLDDHLEVVAGHNRFGIQADIASAAKLSAKEAVLAERDDSSPDVKKHLGSAVRGCVLERIDVPL